MFIKCLKVKDGRSCLLVVEIDLVKRQIIEKMIEK